MCLNSTHNLMMKTASRDFMFTWNNTNQSMFTCSVCPRDVKHIDFTQQSCRHTKVEFDLSNVQLYQLAKQGLLRVLKSHQHCLRQPCWITTSEVKWNTFLEPLHLQDITVNSRSRKSKHEVVSAIVPYHTPGFSDFLSKGLYPFLCSLFVSWK